jgi:tyrosine-protein kinase Etk/Wzc
VNAIGENVSTDEVSLLDYALVVWRWRWMVVAICTASVAVATLVTMMSVKVYESAATLVAPRENQGAGLLGGLAAVAGIGQQAPMSLPSFAPNRDLLLGVLKSRTVAIAVVDRFKLRERYRVPYADDAIKRLGENTVVTMSREGVIVVRVADPDPDVAAQVANFYVAELDRIVAQYGVGEARGQRAFLTAQLARVKADLEGTEDALRRFQERNRAIVLQEQTRGAIEGAARLKGELMAAQVQLQVMRNFATDVNPEVVALRRRVDEMTRQLADMQYGDKLDGAEVERRDFVVPLARLPKVGLELARLMRNAKAEETLVALLTQQVEQAQIAEARDTPVVQTLDRAIPAQRPARPHLGLNLGIAGVVGLFGGMLSAFIFDAIPGRRRGSVQ